MSTRHLLDPQLVAAVEQLPRMLPLTAQTLHARRADYAGLMNSLLPLLPHVSGIDSEVSIWPAGVGPKSCAISFWGRYASMPASRST